MSSEQIEFRDPERVSALNKTLARLCARFQRDITVMHVCGTHEQSIARFGLRSLFPENLHVIMGPGCPVCVTDMPEVDEAIILARQGVIVATFGDIFRVPGSTMSLADAKAQGGDVRIIYSPWEAVRIAEGTDREVVFFASGFETTAVATAAVILSSPPGNFSVLSAHKYILPAMEAVASMEGTRIEGFIAAGHAATITGWGIFEDFVHRYKIPVVTGGFEPLDILAALIGLLEVILEGNPRVVNAYPRCVTREGNLKAQELLWKVFHTEAGVWRGIASIPGGNLRIRPEFASIDARERFHIDLSGLGGSNSTARLQECICGNIMAGLASPVDCNLFGKECTPMDPVGACMVSTEGVCRIWHEYEGVLKIKV